MTKPKGKPLFFELLEAIRAAYAYERVLGLWALVLRNETTSVTNWPDGALLPARKRKKKEKP